MGRPKKEQGKTKQFRLRMRKEDYILLGIIAKECKTSKTNVLMTGFYDLLHKFNPEDQMILDDLLNKAMNKQEEI